MMKKMILFAVSLVPAFLFGQAFEAQLLGHWGNPDLTPTSWLDSRYNEVWGTVQNGHEIAIIGSTAGTHFIDVTDPTTPTEVAFVAGASEGPNLVHRDFHSYNGYLYAVADEGQSTLQIIDMHDLPASVEVVYDSDEFFTRSHNVFVDSLNAVLYVCGGNGGNSVRLLSVENPTAPVLLAEYNSNSTFPIPYVHDVYVRNNIAWLNCGNAGFYLVDFSAPAAPVLLGTLTDYPQKGYNHSGWLANDGIHYYMCDETHGMDVKVVDASDPSDLKVVNLFNAESTPNQIVHNVLVRGNYLYASYYYDGVQVFDISDPVNPVRVSYYDTFDGENDSFYQGAWGVYPFLPSGNVLVSDMNNGLFVVNPFASSVSVQFLTEAVTTCAYTEAEVSFVLNAGFVPPLSFEWDGLPAGATVSFSPAEPMPGDTVSVLIGNLAEAGVFAPELTASDAGNAATTSFELTVESAPAVPGLVMPAHQSADIPLAPEFVWEPTTGASDYQLQVSADSLDFVNGLYVDITTTETSFVPVIPLPQGSILYWRVLAINECGVAISEIHTFTTEFSSGIFEPETLSFGLFPNPARASVVVALRPDVRAEPVSVRLFSATGQALHSWSWPKGQKTLNLEVGDFANGVYWLQLVSATGSRAEKLILAR